MHGDIFAQLERLRGSRAHPHLPLSCFDRGILCWRRHRIDREIVPAVPIGVGVELTGCDAGRLRGSILRGKPFEQRDLLPGGGPIERDAGLRRLRLSALCINDRARCNGTKRRRGGEFHQMFHVGPPTWLCVNAHPGKLVARSLGTRAGRSLLSKSGGVKWAQGRRRCG